MRARSGLPSGNSTVTRSPATIATSQRRIALSTPLEICRPLSSRTSNRPPSPTASTRPLCEVMSSRKLIASSISENERPASDSSPNPARCRHDIQAGAPQVSVEPKTSHLGASGTGAVTCASARARLEYDWQTGASFARLRP